MVAGDDVGDRVGDVLGLQLLKPLGLEGDGFLEFRTYVGAEFGIHGARLDHTHTDVLWQQFLAQCLGERDERGSMLPWRPHCVTPAPSKPCTPRL